MSTTATIDPRARAHWTDRVLAVAIAALIGAQASVFGLLVIGRHIFRQPIPWTEEIARLLVVWLMCVGGGGFDPGA